MKRLIVFLLFLFLAENTMGQIEGWRRKIEGSPLTVGLNPLNPNAVYVQVGSTNLRVSHDRGRTWSLLGNPQLTQIRQIIVHPADTSVILCAAFDGGIRRSIDNGVTWFTVLPDFGIDGESISYDPSHPDTMYAGNFFDGVVYRSSNRGLTWTQMGTSASFLCALAVRPDSGNILLAGTGDGRISKSTDGGATWRQVKEGGSQEIPRIVVSEANPMILYGTGYAGSPASTGIWKSTDGGENWFLTSLHESVWAVDVDNTNADVVYAGTFDLTPAAIYKTTDAGNSWESVATGFPGNGNAWSIKVHPLDPTMVWLGLAGIPSGGLYRLQETETIIRGHVLDSATGDTVRSGSVRVVETGDSVRLEQGSGEYAFGYFDGDPTLSPTLRVLAYPYYIGIEQVGFTSGNTETYDLHLNKLPLSSISGTVLNLAHQPLEGVLRLRFTTITSSNELTSLSNPDGSFFFDSLYITYPPLVQYQSLSIDPAFPFRGELVSSIIVDTNGLVVDRLLDTADVLITGPLGAGDIRNNFMPTLNNIGLTYHYWDVLQGGLAPLSRSGSVKKRSVLYSTGSLGSALTAAEMESLMVCLDGGFHVFVTGNDVVELNDSSEFMSEYALVTFAGNSSLSAVRGVANDIFPVSTMPLFPSVHRDSMYVLSPEALPILRYATVFSNRGIAAIRTDTSNGRGRLILFGFPFEGLAQIMASNNILQAILGYFDGSVVVDVDEELFEVPTEFRLEQNYPNPFNPSTVIRFGVPAGTHGNTTLRVFDILGREVKMLVNKPMEPGTHSVALDGTNLPSGVYFYTLHSGGRTDTRKMLLLK